VDKLIALEIARGLFQIIIRAAYRAGMEREELDKEYDKQWDRFDPKDPALLPDT
jgi:hypothetical protein